MDITVKKTWSSSTAWLDENLQVQMTLKAGVETAANLPSHNETEQTAAVWLTSTEAASGKTWYDLPKYDDTGAAIVYTVDETGMKYGDDPIENWQAVFDTTKDDTAVNTVIIDNTPKETSILVTKIWLNNGTARRDKTSISFEVWQKVGEAEATQYTPDSLPTQVLYQDGVWQTVTVDHLPLYVRTDDNTYVEATYYVVETGETGNTVITYKKETAAEEGEAADQAANGGETITIYNRDASVDINVIKIDESTRSNENPTTLPNAKFTLSVLIENDLVPYPDAGHNEQTTNSEGKLTFEGLRAGRYQISESAAPEGYNSLTFSLYFTIDEDGNVTWTNALWNAIASQNMVEYTPATNTFTIGNTAGVELPATGGMGTTVFYVTGAVMTLGAALWLILRRKRREA